MKQRAPGGDGEGTVSFSYRPSLLGAPWEFRLDGRALDWTAGRKSGRIPLAAIRRVRLSFRPITMQRQRFLTEVWADGAPRLSICSGSWKSMVEYERLDGTYAAFVQRLHETLLAAGAPVRFERGRQPLLFWAGLVVFTAIALALAGLVVVGLQARAWGGTALVAGFLCLFLWQAGNYFYRNRPGPYDPRNLPPELMPPERYRAS